MAQSQLGAKRAGSPPRRWDEWIRSKALGWAEGTRWRATGEWWRAFPWERPRPVPESQRKRRARLHRLLKLQRIYTSIHRGGMVEGQFSVHDLMGGPRIRRTVRRRSRSRPPRGRLRNMTPIPTFPDRRVAGASSPPRSQLLRRCDADPLTESASPSATSSPAIRAGLVTRR
jgi:hypothetical protein